MFACIILFKLQLKMIKCSRLHSKWELKLSTVHFLCTRFIFSLFCRPGHSAWAILWGVKHTSQKFSMDTNLKRRVPQQDRIKLFISRLFLSLLEIDALSFLLNIPIGLSNGFPLSSDPYPTHRKHSAFHPPKCMSPFCAPLPFLYCWPFYSIIISLQQPSNYIWQR